MVAICAVDITYWYLVHFELTYQNHLINMNFFLKKKAIKQSSFYH